MKKLATTLLLLLTITTISYSQEKYRFSASKGFFGHQVDSESINRIGATPGYNNIGNSNYQLGVDYIKMLSKKRASLMISVLYGKWNYGYYYTYRTDSRYYDDYDKTEVTQSSNYLALGLLFREKILIKSKHSIGILLGAQVNDGLIFNENTVKYKDETIVANLNRSNKGYFSMLVKIGISYQYNISDKTGLFIEPNIAVGYEDPFGRGAYANITTGISIF